MPSILKKALISITFLTFFNSCTESYKMLDTEKVNKQIQHRTDIETPEELIRLYYNYSDEGEGKQKLTLKTKNIGEHKFEIILIHEGLLDDSQADQKIIMTANLNGQTWIVNEIKENWKCREGRGHTNWGTGPCE